VDYINYLIKKYPGRLTRGTIMMVGKFRKVESII